MGIRRFAAVLLSIFIITGLAAQPVAAAGPETQRLVEILRQKGVIDDADYAELMKPASPASGDALNRRLIKILYEKGVLDEASFIELAEMSGMDLSGAGGGVPFVAPVMEPVVHAEPAGSPAEATAREAVPALDKGLTAVETGVARAGRDEVSLKINFFFQGGWVRDTAGYSVGGPPTTDLSLTAGNQFFVRRARLYLSGNVLKKIGYKVSFETASSKILRDAYVYADYIPHARLTVGQFKVPFGYEGPLALAELPVANRSLVTNLVHAPTLRDRGVMLSGKYTFSEGEDPLAVSYYFAGVNGNGFNTSDDNSEKDFAMRVRLNPGLPCITVGGSLYMGTTRQADGADRDRERWAAELEFLPKHLKGFKVLAEYMQDRRFYDTYVSRDVTATTGLPAVGRYVHSNGWYALAAYRVDGLGGTLSFLNGLEPAVRYGYLDEDSAVSDNERYRTTLGLNYYLAKDTRLMLNYEFIHADGMLALQSLEKIDNISHELLTTMLQVKF